MDGEQREARGWTRLGSLMPGIAPSPPALDSTPGPSPSASATTGLPAPVRKASSSIGRPRGATGVAAKRSVSELLDGSDPEATDQALLAGLRRLIGESMRPLERERIDPVYGYDVEVVGYRWEATPLEPALTAARELIAQATVPMAPAQLKGEIARLKASTKARAEQADELTLTMAVLAEECALWPADVVRSALRGYAARETWFPSLAELRDQLQRHGRNRRLLAQAMSAV